MPWTPAFCSRDLRGSPAPRPPPARRNAYARCAYRPGQRDGVLGSTAIDHHQCRFLFQRTGRANHERQRWHSMWRPSSSTRPGPGTPAAMTRFHVRRHDQPLDLSNSGVEVFTVPNSPCLPRMITAAPELRSPRSALPRYAFVSSSPRNACPLPCIPLAVADETAPCVRCPLLFIPL